MAYQGYSGAAVATPGQWPTPAAAPAAWQQPEQGAADYSAYYQNYYPQQTAQYPYAYPGYDYSAYTQGYQYQPAQAPGQPGAPAAPPLPSTAAPALQTDNTAPPPPPGTPAAPANPEDAPPPPPPGTSAPPQPTAHASAATGSATAQPAQQPAAAPYDPSAYAQYYSYYYGYDGQQQPTYGQPYPQPGYGYGQPPAQPYPTAPPPQHAAPPPTASPAVPASKPPSYQQQPTPSGLHGARPASATASGSNTVPVAGRGPAAGGRGAGFLIRPQGAKKPSTVMTPTNAPSSITAPHSSYASAVTGPTAPVYVRAQDRTTTTTPVSTSASAAAAADKSAGLKYPSSFSLWVERCFNRCKTEAERTGLSQALLVKIKDVEGQGRMWLTDWDMEPLVYAGPPPTVKPSSTTSTMPEALSPNSSRAKRGRWDSHSRSAQDYDSDEEDKSWGNKVHKKQKNGKRHESAVQRDNGRASTTAEAARRQQRAGRFSSTGNAGGGGGGGSYRRIAYPSSDDEAVDFADLVVKGTSNKLEKSYFRLTGVPDPSEVRPEPVLAQALDRLTRMIRSKEVNYFYTCDQFKGLRQDCTVQHLRNALAVRVYEAHGRNALVYGDLAEFNQCQTQLHMMYADGQPGCLAEFTAYKILYETVHASQGLSTALLRTLKHMAPAVAGTPEVKHALKVREAVMSSNYGAFFALYAVAPKLGRAILDVHAEPMRWATLNVVTRVYKTSLPLTFVSALLGFMPQPAAAAASAEGNEPLPGCNQAVLVGDAAPAADEAGAVAACAKWLRDHGAVLEGEGADQQLDAKSSVGKLFIPEAPKVSHGDENLSLGDFLAKAALNATAVF